MKPLCRNDQGFGLVELLVALTLTSILLLGLFQVFQANQRSLQVQQSLSRIQENARFAFYFLTRDMRSAGYRGCARDAVFNNFLKTDSFVFDFARPIEGFAAIDGGWSPALPAEIASRGVLPGSDVLVVRNINSELTFDVSTVSREAVTRFHSASTEIRVQPGDLLLVTDCLNAAVWQATDRFSGQFGVIGVGDAATLQPGNRVLPNASQAPSFGPGARVSPIATTAYYVATGVSGEPALFRSISGGPGQELVEGVERLRLRYGIDTVGDGVVDQYLLASPILPWDRVLTMRMALIIRGPIDDVIDEPQRFFFDDEIIVSPDRRLRTLVASTVALRNRLP